MIGAVGVEPTLLVDPAAVDALRASFGEVGVAVLGPPALAPSHHLQLLDEAVLQRAGASWALTGSAAKGEIDQETRRAHLGPLARGFLASTAVAELLRAVTGRALAPGWPATCYTYYEGPGQFLGEHCDKPESCQIAMLTYLDVRWGPSGAPGPGLGLTVFEGDNSSTPVVATVTARANRIAIINGAAQAHRRPPLDLGEGVILLAGCFAVV